MGVGKVEYAGKTLVDLTADTIKASTLLEGITAHGADGESVVGTAQFIPEYDLSDDLIPTSIDTDGSIFNGVGYQEDCRFSTSSVAFTTSSGNWRTGYIPCTQEDTFVVKLNTKVGNLAIEYMVFFDADFKYIGINSPYIAYRYSINKSCTHGHGAGIPTNAAYVVFTGTLKAYKFTVHKALNTGGGITLRVLFFYAHQKGRWRDGSKQGGIWRQSAD